MTLKLSRHTFYIHVCKLSKTQHVYIYINKYIYVHMYIYLSPACCIPLGIKKCNDVFVLLLLERKKEMYLLGLSCAQQT
jgi:hypothetical protein